MGTHTGGNDDEGDSVRRTDGDRRVPAGDRGAGGGQADIPAGTVLGDIRAGDRPVTAAATPVFLTIDTEFAWRHHAAGLDADSLYRRSIEPADVGLTYQLALLRAHGLKACFFVDPMPALLYGIDPFRRIVEAIRAAGQEVQLHLHPRWARADAVDRTASDARRELRDFALADQRALIAQAAELLVAAGAAPPTAFRAGTYGANDDTLVALAGLGFGYDSSHSGAALNTSEIDLPADQICPIERCGIVEVPVTIVRDGPVKLRPLQLCALSSREMAAALQHAVANDHAATTIVSHCFELANRAATQPNRVHVRRFRALCALLERHASALPTAHFADRPALRLGAADRPVALSPIERRRRQAEQLWSNWVAERAN